MRISDWNSDVCSSDLGERESAIHFKLGDDASRKGARIVHRHKGSQFSTFKRFTNTGRTIRGDAGQATDQCFVTGIAGRSEDRRVGTACGSTTRFRWPPYPYKPNLTKPHRATQHTAFT